MNDDTESLAGWYTLAQASKLLGMSHRALVQWVVRHRVPMRRVGRAYVLRISDLAEAGLKVPLNVGNTLAKLL